MPLRIQYVWLAYQLYVALAMYFARFMKVASWAALEEGIATELCKGSQPRTLWYSHKAQSVVDGSLSTTAFGSYREAKDFTAHVLRDRNDPKHTSKTTERESD